MKFQSRVDNFKSVFNRSFANAFEELDSKRKTDAEPFDNRWMAWSDIAKNSFRGLPSTELAGRVSKIGPICRESLRSMVRQIFFNKFDI